MATFDRAIFPENTATGVSTEFQQPGKTYGSRVPGDVSGRLKTYGDTVELAFEVTPDAAGNVPAVIGDNEYKIKSITLMVERAFAGGSTANLSIDGGSGLSTPLPLSVEGISEPALTGLGNQAGKGPVDVEISINGTAQNSATGHAEVIVKYLRV